MTATVLAPPPETVPLDIRPETYPEEQESQLSGPQPRFYNGYYHDGRLQIVITGLDHNIRNHALDEAHAAFQRKLSQPGTRGFFSRIITGTITRGHYIQKQARQAKKTIVEQGNLLHFHNADPSSYAMPVTERFAHPSDTFIRHGVGEQRAYVHLTKGKDDGASLRRDVQRLIYRYAEQEVDLTDQVMREFNKKADALIKKHAKSSHVRELLGGKHLHAHNLWETVVNVRTLAEQQSANAGMLLSQADFIVGQAHVGPRETYRRSKMERFTDTLERVVPINETSVIGGATLAASLGGLALQRTANMMTAALLPGLGAAIWAGMREGRIRDDERTVFLRRAALEKGVSARDLETYDSVSMSHLIDTLYDLHDQTGRLVVADTHDLTRVLNHIIDCDVRLRLSDHKDINLLSAPADKYDEFYIELISMLNVTKQNLLEWIKNTDDYMLQKQYGLSEGFVEQAKDEACQSFDYLMKLPDINIIRRNHGGAALDDIEQRDKDYRRNREWRRIKTMGKAALAGALFGTVIQEAAALALPGLQGYFEGTSSGSNTRRTYLAGLLHHDSGTTMTQALVSDSNDGYKQVTLSKNSLLQIPAAFDTSAGQNTFGIKGPHNVNLQGLSWQADGTLTKSSLEQLEAAGFTIEPKIDTAQASVLSHRTVSPAEYVKSHPELTKKTTVGHYYDNGTSYADGNETKLHFGGVDKNGNYIIKFDGMNSRGSRYGNTTLNSRSAAANGHLVVGITASNDTEGRVFTVPVNKDGVAIIDKDSPLGTLFKKDSPKSHPKFIGYLLQILHIGSKKGGNMVVNPVASMVGENRAKFVDVVPAPRNETVVSYTLSYNTPVSTASTTTPSMTIPAFVPIYGRRGIAPVRAKTPKAPTDVALHTPAKQPLRPATPPIIHITPAAAPSASPPLYRPVEMQPPVAPPRPEHIETEPANTSDRPQKAAAQATHTQSIDKNAAAAQRNLERLLYLQNLSIVEAHHRLARILEHEGYKQDEDFTFSEDGRRIIFIKIRNKYLPRHAQYDENGKHVTRARGQARVNYAKNNEH